MNELAAQFERTNGHKLVIHFDSTPNLIKQATSGAPFDLAVVPVDVFKDAAARARFAAGPTIDIARVGYGVIVRVWSAEAGHRHAGRAEEDPARQRNRSPSYQRARQALMS